MTPSTALTEPLRSANRTDRSSTSSSGAAGSASFGSGHWRRPRISAADACARSRTAAQTATLAGGILQRPSSAAQQLGVEDVVERVADAA